MTLKSLTYEMWSAPEASVFAGPDSRPFELAGFRCRVEGQTLRAEPIDAVVTVDAGRTLLERALRDWEIELAMSGQRVEFRHTGSTEEGPRNPEGGRHINVNVVERLAVTDSVSFILTRSMSGPSGSWKSTPEVEFLLRRWIQPDTTYTDRPTASAYALVTFVDGHYGGLTVAAERLGVSSKLLKQAKKLSSQPDAEAGRKVSDLSTSLTPAQLGWLNQFIWLVAKRMAAVESGQPNEPRLTLADLPAVTETPS